MIIIVDEEARKYIEGFCHVALKGGGMNNLEGVNKVLDTMEEIKDDKKPDTEVEEPKTTKISKESGDKKNG